MQIDSERDLEKLLNLCGTEAHTDINDINISAYALEEKEDCILIHFGHCLQRFNLCGSNSSELLRLFAVGMEIVGDLVKVAGGMKFLQAVESFENRSFSFCSKNAGRVLCLTERLNLPCTAVIKEENAELCGRFKRVILIGDNHKIPEEKDTQFLLFAKDEEEAERLSKKFCDCYLATVI